MSNRNSKKRNSKQAKKLQLKRIALKRQIEQILENNWTYLTIAKQEYEARKELLRQYEARKKIIRQNFQPILEVDTKYTFDDYPIFEDIMDEQKAEGKGYGGSK